MSSMTEGRGQGAGGAICTSRISTNGGSGLWAKKAEPLGLVIAELLDALPQVNFSSSGQQ